MPTVRTHDIETFYERRGSGPPIVFIHGAITNRLQWTPQVDALSSMYTTVTYDVRGHGRTGSSALESYSIERFAEDLEALLTSLSLERPVLCGLSMGGCIAQMFAARHPERMAGLVLADTFAPELVNRRDWLMRASLSAAIPPARLLGYERVERMMVWVHERFSRGASGEYAKIEELRAKEPTMATDEFAKVIRALSDFKKAEVDLGAISVPTLVIYGANEPAVIRQHASKFRIELPNASVQEIPGAGHTSNLDNPDVFTDALRDFLSTVFPPTSEPISGEVDGSA